MASRHERSGHGRGLEWAAISAVGLVREINEDRVGVFEDPSRGQWFVVADGMGGHQAGEVAAEQCKAALRTAWSHAAPDASPSETFDALLAAFIDAHARNRSLNRGAGRPPGCTAIAAAIDPVALRAIHLYAGDCRLHHYRDGALIYRTQDHTIAEILRQQGQISEDEMIGHSSSSMVLSCLGGETDVPDLAPKWVEGEGAEQPAVRALEPGDVLLMSSDGVHGTLPQDEMAATVAAHVRAPRALAAALESGVLERGAPDNYSLVVVRIPTDGYGR